MRLRRKTGLPITLSEVKRSGEETGPPIAQSEARGLKEETGLPIASSEGLLLSLSIRSRQLVDPSLLHLVA